MIAAIIPADSVVERATCWTDAQQITYDYATETVLPMLKSNGVWMAPASRSPLSTEEVLVVFIAITRHPNYDGQTMGLADRDGARITYNGADEIFKVELFPEAIA